MNGQPTVNHPTTNNEQLIGKFHVVNVDKIPTNPVNSHDEIPANAQQPPAVPSSTTDESTSSSRFQMIRVDRNFVRGRWKVNDYEPPENISTSINTPVNTIENEPVNISNASTYSTMPIVSTTSTIQNVPTNASAVLPSDSNSTSSATLAATAASAAAAAATAFQQQQRLAMTNPTTVAPPANVPPPAGLLHGYSPAALANMAASNQSYILPNHPQFGYYPFFPPPYSPYAAQWAALAAANSYLPPPPMAPPQQQPSQLQPGSLGDTIRLADGDVTNENPTISSAPFPNPTVEHLQNASIAAAAPFIYASSHPHSPFVSQAQTAGASPYATIASYHPAPPPPTILPPPTQPLTITQPISTSTAETQSQSHPAPILTSPKHETSSTKQTVQQSNVPKTTIMTAPTNLIKPLTTIANTTNTDMLKATATINSAQVPDLLSSSPAIPNSQNPPPTLLSPIAVQTANSANINTLNKGPTTTLNDLWPYAPTGSPLNVSHTAAETAAVTAVAAMGLLNNENAKNTEIANVILKELTTPTKQNNTTDIDNKISAAMDLVKMHLLSAVRDEVTELRQQIATLNEKVTNVEHENAFLRQHVSNEVYAQYIPLIAGSSTGNELSNPAATVTSSASTIPTSSVTSSQSMATASVPAVSSSIVQQPSTTTISQAPSVAAPSSMNLPAT